MFQPIAVDDLRVGMYIHLEGGWLSHPFPLSSFKLTSPEQIAVIRGLTRCRLQWSPEKSDPAPADGPAGGPAGGDTPAPPEAGAAGAAGDDGIAAGATAAADASDASDASDAPDTPDTPGTPGAGAAAGAATQAQRATLEAQRHALQRCERQHAEAGRAFRAAQALVPSRPAQAREAAQALVGDMLAQMDEAGDIGIRLLAAPGGDRGTAHALNVTVISMLIGRTFGLGPAEMAELGLGALLHDVGKIDLPERVRHADDQMGAGELAAWREHVPRGLVHGRRMALPEGALAVLAQHHEHADGSGFPAALRGDAMTLPARIVAIVNRYDNLCNPPLLARALTPHEAVSTLFAQGRAKYDPAVLGAFIRMMGVYPAGSLVQLTDDRFGMVAGVNSSRPLKPRVLVHDPRVPRHQALVLDLEHCQGLGIRRSLTAARVPPAVLQWLDPRPRLAYYFEPLPREEREERERGADAATAPAAPAAGAANTARRAPAPGPRAAA
jgi:HD-GYP domain-containing protein (c-di-GMP phosphodiesterase class II)